MITLIIILIVVGILAGLGFFIIHLWEDKDSGTKTLKKRVKLEESTKKKDKEVDIKKLWKDKEWVEENLINRKVITWNQYEAFKGKKGIYKFTINKYSKNGNTKTYIGQSHNLIQRLSTHIYSASHDYQKGEQYITSALRIQLEQNKYIEWTILEFASSQEELDEKERFYIAQYSDEFGFESLYNKDQGGIHYH